jgi:hypothetical protein
LFGYDTGVISGAILYLRGEFRLSPTTEGLVAGVADPRCRLKRAGALSRAW